MKRKKLILRGGSVAPMSNIKKLEVLKGQDVRQCLVNAHSDQELDNERIRELLKTSLWILNYAICLLEKK